MRHKLPRNRLVHTCVAYSIYKNPAMLILFLYLLGLLSGALSSKNACLHEAKFRCNVYTIIPHPFPETVEELRRACDHLNDVKQCLADSAKNCSSQDTPDDAEEDEDSEERYRRRLKDSQNLIDVTTEICKEDSQLHLNFVPDMACYNEVFETNNREQHCRDYSNNVMNYLRSRLRAKIAGNEEQSGKYYECLRVLSDMNCFLELFIEKCSDRAEATVVEIIEKGGSLDDQCPVSIRLDILELIDALKLLTRKDMHVRQLLETDSFF